MNNLLVKTPNGTETRALLEPLQSLVDRLDALTMVLKSCKGETCTHPWKALHPEGDVESLTDAMKHKFDEFYAKQPKVSFDECSPGYIIAVEGPQEYDVYGGGASGRRRQVVDDDWSFWV